MVDSGNQADRLAQDLKRAILSGAMAPETRLLPIRELARQYGISYGRAQRAIKRLEADGLLVSRQGGGTFVATHVPTEAAPPAAWSTDGKRSRTTVVVPSRYWRIRHISWITDILRGFERVMQAASAPFDTVFAEDLGSLPVQSREERRGFLVVPGAWDPRQLARLLVAGHEGTSIVVVSDDPAYAEWSLAVGVDAQAGMSKVLEFVLGHGHTDIAFLSWERSGVYETQGWWLDEREATYRAVMARGGLKARVVEVKPSGRHGQRAPALAEQLGSLLAPEDTGPSALVCVNDLLAVDVIEYCEAHGIRVHDDISVAGFDDQPLALSAGLTTVHRPFREMGEFAADILLRAERTTGCRGRFLAEPLLVQRRSVGFARRAVRT